MLYFSLSGLPGLDSCLTDCCCRGLEVHLRAFTENGAWRSVARLSCHREDEDNPLKSKAGEERTIRRSRSRLLSDVKLRPALVWPLC